MPYFIFGFDIGTILEQHLQRLHVSVLCGPQERCPLALVPGVPFNSKFQLEFSFKKWLDIWIDNPCLKKKLQIGYFLFETRVT